MKTESVLDVWTGNSMVLLTWSLVFVQVKAPPTDPAQTMSSNAVVGSASLCSTPVMSMTTAGMSQMSSAVVSQEIIVNIKKLLKRDAAATAA